MAKRSSITVITPTNRLGSLHLVDVALRRQTDQDFEWLIITPEPKEFSSYNATVLEDPGRDEGDYWSLYKSYNKAISHAKGEYILSVQDSTFFDADTISKLKFNMTPTRLITGVGGKYTDVYPICGPETWHDPRETGGGGLDPCIPQWFEFNFGCFPRKAIYDVGGFDEYMDRYSGICGLDVVERLDILGDYEFFIDQSMKSYSLDHGRPDQWEERNGIHGPYQERRKTYTDPKLGYL